jgi:hypothetical protein
VNEDQVGEVAFELRQFAKTGLHDDSAQRRRRLLERCPILRGLAPVQVAGADSKAQWEYLIQTIVDAVDVIGQAASARALTSAVPSLTDGAREAEALPSPLWPYR